MKNLFIAFICTFALAACSSTQSELVTQNLDSMVVIFNQPAKSDPSGTTENGMSSPQNPKEKGGGLGTGFIIGENIIVTNNHVVEGKGNILKVTGNNDLKMYDAHIIASDKAADIAVIKIDDWEDFKKNMNPRILPWGSSRDLKVGDTVWSMGNPYGLFFTVAQGIISHKLRPADNKGHFYIQTTTEIYPGNSGGPLLNQDGEVIGINSAIFGKEGFFGMAIPSDLARKIINDLLKYKEIKSCRLGLMLGQSDDKHNVAIKGIDNASPAIEAGLLPNDIIMSISTPHTDGWTKIDNPEQLIYEVQLMNCGEKMKLEVVRDEKSRIIETGLIESSLP